MPKVHFHILAFSLVLFVRVGLADTIVVTKQPPGDIEECKDNTLSWTGGTPPYLVQVETDQGVPVDRVVTDTYLNECVWTPDLGSPGYQIQFVVSDSYNNMGSTGKLWLDPGCPINIPYPTSSAKPSSTIPPTTSSKPSTLSTATSTTPPASSPNTSPASSTDGPTTGTPAQQTSPGGTPTQQTSPGDSSQTPASPSPSQTINSPSPSGSSPGQTSSNPSGSTFGTPTTSGASNVSGLSPSSGSNGTGPNETGSNPPNGTAFNPSGAPVHTGLSSSSSPASTTSQPSHSSNAGLYAGIGVGIVAALLLLLGGAVVWRRRRLRRAWGAEELAAAPPITAGGREEIVQTKEKETTLMWVDDLQMHDPAARAATPVRRGKRAMQAPSLDEQPAGVASSSAPARELPETDVPHLPAAITPDAADEMPLVTLSTNDLVRELQARMEADAMRSHTEDLPEYIEDEPRR